jgi:hypothetical protein
VRQLFWTDRRKSGVFHKTFALPVIHWSESCRIPLMYLPLVTDKNIR